MSSPENPLPAIVRRLRAAGCVYAEDEARLLIAATADEQSLTALVEQRAAGSPLEQLLGWAEFRGQRIALAPGVFVPRRRTEFLVERALAALPEPGVVVDLCCGSGAIAAAIAAQRPAAEIHAVDVDPEAVACARRNLAGRGQVHQGDLDEPLPCGLRGRVDVVVANAPYVPTGEIGMMPSEARDYEPGVALDGGADGLDIARRVVGLAPGWLTPGGQVLVETSESQANELARAIGHNGLSAEIVHSEEFDATVAVGRNFWL